MWETTTDQRTEFVYVLAWPDEQTKSEAWDALMADEEWAKIKRETRETYSQLVGSIEDRLQ